MPVPSSPKDDPGQRPASTGGIVVNGKSSYDTHVDGEAAT
jgi:hypothetical protein